MEPWDWPFSTWDDVDEWTGAREDRGWRGRRLVFEGCWVLHMSVDAGFGWAHAHPQSQVVWLTSGELLAKIGDPAQPGDVREQIIRPGDVLKIPGNVHHDMTALTDLDAWEVRGMEGPDDWETYSIRVRELIVDVHRADHIECTDRDTRLQQAVSLREAGDAETARPLLVALAAEYPDDADIQYQAGWVHDRLGLEAEAIPYYESA